MACNTQNMQGLSVIQWLLQAKEKEYFSSYRCSTVDLISHKCNRYIKVILYKTKLNYIFLSTHVFSYTYMCCLVLLKVSLFSQSIIQCNLFSSHHLLPSNIKVCLLLKACLEVLGKNTTIPVPWKEQVSSNGEILTFRRNAHSSRSLESIQEIKVHYLQPLLSILWYFVSNCVVSPILNPYCYYPSIGIYSFSISLPVYTFTLLPFIAQSIFRSALLSLTWYYLDHVPHFHLLALEMSSPLGTVFNAPHDQLPDLIPDPTLAKSNHSLHDLDQILLASQKVFSTI